MPENNPFSNPNKDLRHSGGILDIDKIIEQEKVHAHRGAVPIAEPVQVIEKLPEIDQVEPQIEVFKDIQEQETPLEISNLPVVEDPVIEPVEVEPQENIEQYDNNNESEQTDDNSQEDVSSWQPPTRRIPRMERFSSEDETEVEEVEPINEMTSSETMGDIIINNSKNTPNKRNLLLILGTAVVIIGLIFLIPQLINSGFLYKADNDNTTGNSGQNSDTVDVRAGLSQDVAIRKVSDGLESDDPDKWEITLTADTTDITLSVDCTSKPGGGTSPNLSCVGSGGGSNEVVDGTFVKPFTAGEGWKYEGPDYGYCFSFADKVSAKTVQTDLFGSSGIQLFYMAEDFKLCSKQAGNPDNIPQNTPCDNQRAYCPAVRLRTIK
jgi:hypothetical protein